MTLAAIPSIEEESVADVSGSSATLQARINPGALDTTYRFEYAKSEAALLAGEGEVFPAPPAPEGEAGAGSGGVVVEVHPQDLTPRTNYWYRVLAKNGEGETPGCRMPGTCQSLTTRPAGGEFELPDGRAWELVSPAPGSSGASAAIEPIEPSGVLIQAAVNGDAFSYGVIGSTEADPAGEAFYSQAFSARGDDGWSSRDIATPHEHAAPLTGGSEGEYKFFSPDLAVGLVEPLEEAMGSKVALLSPAASEETSYLRADAPLLPEAFEQEVYTEAQTEGGYLPLVTGCPPPASEKCKLRVEERANVFPGAVFGGATRFDGATADLSHVVLASDVPLTEKTPDGETTEGEGLYEWAAGRLQLISVLPEGVQSKNPSKFGADDEDARGAISSDGSRVVWSSGENLYLREVSNEQTVQIDTPEEHALGGGGQATFQFANSNGSRVFFSDEAQLTVGSTADREDADLYECEIVEEVGRATCKLTDLTVDSNNGQHANVRAGFNGGSVLGASEDGSYVYFVAEGELTEVANGRNERAENGQFNLYVSHYDTGRKKWEAPVFIAVLSTEDQPSWGGQYGVPSIENITSRVSPNGEYLAFMSDRRLTGYNNTDANSSAAGAADEEVYLYRAPSAGAPSGQLVCASCNPTGERPTGVLDRANPVSSVLADQEFIWRERWLAGIVPGWTAMENGAARYQSRYLSDEGRLFFDSPDALVPQATNGVTDVYEYEPAGVGGCGTSSVTFSGHSNGCVALISSGSSGEESAFLDASEDGNDVFFLSSARLAPADTGSALAVYDAHVCLPASPCSVEASFPASCATEAACKPAPTPQPAIFGPGPSETFSGAGNPAPGSGPPAVIPKPTKCKKGFVKKHARCVRKKNPKKAKRASNHRRAGR